jgi:hypothetical protein
VTNVTALVVNNLFFCQGIIKRFARNKRLKASCYFLLIKEPSSEEKEQKKVLFGAKFVVFQTPANAKHKTLVIS